MNHLFWKDKRVIITGHTGFKGGWLSIWLTYLGANILGLALKPKTEPNLFGAANISDAMESVIGDVRDYNLVLKTFNDFRPELIFHLAAQPIVRVSYESPIDTFSTNIMGLVHVLESARSISSVRAVVNITSDKCYENKEWIWPYRETDEIGGSDPYSSSKGCAELITSAYKRSYFSQRSVGLASARAGNVIGGGDWSADRIVPDFFRAMKKNDVLVVRNPTATRPWQHVLEPISGYLMLAERLYESPKSFSEAWNFGPEPVDIKSVGWLVNRLTQITGSFLATEVSTSERLHEAMSLSLDSSKAKDRLKWLPRIPLDKALEMTVKWEAKRSAGKNMRDITIEQIEEYIETAK